MRLVACGFGISADPLIIVENVRRVSVLYAGYFSTIIEVDGRYYYLGTDMYKEIDIGTLGTDARPTITNVFGTDTDPLGAVSDANQLFEFDRSELCFNEMEAHPTIASYTAIHVCVLASLEVNVAVLVNGNPDDRISTAAEPQVLKFRHHSDLFKWHREGVNAVGLANAVPLPAPATADVRSGAVTFAARLADGSVATWGTPSHGHLLGRQVDHELPPHVPCTLDLPPVGMVRAERASLCGTLGAVVTSNGGAYVWGDVLSPPLVGTFSLSMLFGEQEQQLLRLVVIEEPGGGQLDVIDMDVGMSHLVCLTTGGRVWVAGTNESGQLGLPVCPPKTEWTRLGDFVATKVVCGPQSTFLICNDDDGSNV